MKNLALCHLEAYTTIHNSHIERGFTGSPKVGVAHHLRVFDSFSSSIFDKIASSLCKKAFQDAIVEATAKGNLSFPLGVGKPKGSGIYSDFLGINYYTRDMVRASLRSGYRLSVKTGAPVNDLGWEIYPEGLYRICKEYYKKYNLPIYITENGTCDREDSFRIRYIADHLYQVSRLIDEGIPIKRYYHWTLMDNFEWVEGESAPFGLIKCDFETQERTIRKSGRFFATICEKKGLTENIIREFSQ